jgi:hypothetical protein
VNKEFIQHIAKDFDPFSKIFKTSTEHPKVFVIFVYNQNGVCISAAAPPLIV